MHRDVTLVSFCRGAKYLKSRVILLVFKPPFEYQTSPVFRWLLWAYNNPAHQGFVTHTVTILRPDHPNGISNGIYHSKTEHFCLVFKLFGSTDTKIIVDHSKTGPFVNRSDLHHSNTGLVRYSDGFCIA